MIGVTYLKLQGIDLIRKCDSREIRSHNHLRMSTARQPNSQITFRCLIVNFKYLNIALATQCL
jgi:hypothetical protein